MVLFTDTRSRSMCYGSDDDTVSVADPGFPVGGCRPHTGGADVVGGGRQLPRWLHFKKFVCQNERIWTRRGARAGGAPWIRHCVLLQFMQNIHHHMSFAENNFGLKVSHKTAQHNSCFCVKFTLANRRHHKWWSSMLRETMEPISSTSSWSRHLTEFTCM